MTIASYLDLSTKYITAHDAILLGEHDLCGPSGLIVIRHPFGWFVHIEQNPEDLALLIPRIRARGYSATFIGLLYYASDREFWWINLDQDGEDEGGLPTFDW